MTDVASADLNYASKLLVVRPKDTQVLSLLDQSIISTVNRIGFGIKKQSQDWIQNFHKNLEDETIQKISWTQVFLVWFLAMWSSMLAFAGYLGGDLTKDEHFYLALASSCFGLPAIILGIIPYAKSGIRALLRSKMLTLDIFIFFGGISAATVSLISLLQGSHLTYADSGSMIIGVLLLAKRIEISVFSSVTSNILYQVHPKETSVQVFRRNEWKKADVAQIKKGDRLKVSRGDTVPFDGVLESEIADLNIHLLNGESNPVRMKCGDHLLAGAIAHSDFEMLVSQPLGHRKIDNWAEAALLAASNQSKHATLFAKIENTLVVGAFCGATSLALIRALSGGNFTSVVEAFFVGILVFCPCLFASIIPLTKQIAYLALLKAGVLMRRDDALLDLPGVNRFYLDKTGTLEAVDTTFVPQNPNDLSVQPHLKAATLKSQHPILRGLDLSGTVSVLKHMEEHPGLGLLASSEDDHQLIIGKPSFLASKGISVSDHEQENTLVALDGQIVGQLMTKAVYDQKSQIFLQNLVTSNPQHRISILSGDPNFEAGRRLARLDGRITYRGNLSPEEKADLIEGRSAYVGDGLNDTLALAKSSVSFRIGNRIQGFAPVDFEIQAPVLDVVLDVLNYARKYRMVLIQTACAALVYNVIALSLAALDYFSPLGAVLAMLTSFGLMLMSVSRLNHISRRP